MRHFRSILYALVLAPAVWILVGAGLTRDLTTRGRDDFAVESATGFLLLLLAGAAYGILVLAPISPAGPSLAGVAMLGIAGWALAAPAGYASVWPADVTKAGFDLSRPGYGLAALFAVPLILTALSVRRWESYEPPVLPIIGQLGRARGAAAAPGTSMAVLDTAVIDISGVPGSSADAESTQVLPLPMETSSSEPASPDEDVTTALGDSGTTPDDEATTALGGPGEITTALGNLGEVTTVIGGPGEVTTVIGGSDEEASDEEASDGDEPAGAPDEPAASADEPADEPDDEEEPVADSSQEELAAAVPAPDEPVDEQPPGEKTTRSLKAPDPDRTRIIPLPLLEPPAETEPPAEVTHSLRAADPDSTRVLHAAGQETTRDLSPADEETTREVTATDADSTRDLSERLTDPEQTQAVRPPSGDPAAETQDLRGSAANARAVPGTGDVSGDRTQVIRMPGKRGDQESTQVIRAGLVQPPGERTQVINIPVAAPDDTEPGTPAGKQPPASIAGAEQPDNADDPTSRIVPPATRTGEQENGRRAMTVTNMERAPDEIAEDTTRADIPTQRRPTSDS